MAETPFMRKQEYEAVTVWASSWDDTTELSVQDESGIATAVLSADEVKELRKKLKNALNKKEN